MHRASAADREEVAVYDGREIGVEAAERTPSALPVLHWDPRSPDLRASREEWLQRQCQHVVDHSRLGVGRRRVVIGMCRAREIVARQRLHAIAVAGQLLKGSLIVVLDHASSMQDVGRLTENQPEIGPLDQEVVEVDEAFAACDACCDL